MQGPPQPPSHTAAALEMAATGSFLVSLGSYERILYGVDVHVAMAHGADRDGAAEGAPTVTPRQSFAIPAHLGCIKSIASSPRFLACGSSDETVRLFDIRRRKELGSLSQHQGSVCAVAFTATGSHMLTGGEDGRISLYRTRDWECLHVLRNKRAVNGLAIHPSGKLALAVGQGRSLRIWNLMTAKLAHATLLEEEPLRVAFSPSGKHYAILSLYTLAVFATLSSKLVLKLTVADYAPSEHASAQRLAALAFLHDDRIYFGGEGGSLRSVDLAAAPSTEQPSRPSVRSLATGHAPRIKDMAIVSMPRLALDILVTADSAGCVKGWNVADGREIFSHATTIRITCLTAALTADAAPPAPSTPPTPKDGSQEERHKNGSNDKVEKKEKVDKVGKKDKKEKVEKVGKKITKDSRSKAGL